MNADADQNISYVKVINGKALPNILKPLDLVFGLTSDGLAIVYHANEIHLKTRIEIKNYLNQFKLRSEFRFVDAEELAELVNQQYESEEELDETQAEELFAEVFQAAVDQNASDIHIFTYSYDPHIEFRVNGEIRRYKHRFKLSQNKLDRMIKCIYLDKTGNTGSNKNSFRPDATQSAAVEERRAENGHRFKLRYQDAQLDGDEKHSHVVLRLLDLDKDFSNGTLTDLGYEEDQQEFIFDAMLKGGGGLVIFVGATGDGKTTTAATVLGKLSTTHKGRKKIITVEDPVEFNIPGVDHTQVQPKDNEETLDEAWERHLAAMMRRDPDFILQGEMRTKATAESAAHSALTGHTTLVTLHGNSAFDAFSRLLEMDLPPSLLGANGFIKGIVYQRLMPVVCPCCSIKFKDHKDSLKTLVDNGYATNNLLTRLIKNYGSFLSNVAFRNYEGCDQCDEGLVGREAACETLMLDSGLRQLIAKEEIDAARNQWEGQGHSKIFDSANTLESHYEQHCVGFSAFDHAVKKMLEGKVSPVDVEDKLGVLSQSAVMYDNAITGDEVSDLTGLNAYDREAS